MTENDIGALRDAVARSKPAGAVVIWKGPDGDTHIVRSVPHQKLDPDRTGVADYVAYLDHGHIDLSDVETNSFMVARPLFDALPVVISK